MLHQLHQEVLKVANKEKGLLLQRFFKTGKGEYGEGDIFLGITVPQSRKIAIQFKDLSFAEIAELLKSKYHEERLIALLILVHRFENNPLERKEIFDFYLNNTKYINNWDLVDLSSHHIVGGYLVNQSSKGILIKLARSNNIWEKRIAVISTFEFIRNKQFDCSLMIAEILISDPHDLIQKAVGWMLREIGKRELNTELVFLNKYYKQMGRTALRYSIEKFPEKLRLQYLHGEM